MNHYNLRTTPLAAPILMCLAALCGLMVACVTSSPPTPTPMVAKISPAQAPAALMAPAAPSPADYVNADDYLDGKADSEKIPTALEPATEELRAAAIMAMLNDKWSRQDFQQAKFGYVAVGVRQSERRDPSDTLMQSIKGASLPLKKFSTCTADGQSVRDSATGSRGVLLVVCRICWTGPESALLEYGYITGGIHSRITTAEATRSGGTWKFNPRKIAVY